MNMIKGNCNKRFQAQNYGVKFKCHILHQKCFFIMEKSQKLMIVQILINAKFTRKKKGIIAENGHRLQNQ